MDRPTLLQKVVEWLRAGYPDGVPHTDYIPLVALLRRQLTDDEVTQVSAELVRDSALPPEPISRIDAGVKITHYTHELPHEDDISRVRAHLVSRGWPFSDDPAGNAPSGEGPRGDDPAGDDPGGDDPTDGAPS
ncbi:DUF3349 domain-containing protein [Gordonia lacunae]|uniref:DUF3349 domain-containing protein n=1 Tax=Gordonia lacunae TaxID=417102 RepID=A0A243QAI5_9ACTN|nr:DUF3349 domain-containing protein [Gordonia lacunae]OUC78328.1 hypothetical protein CA982_12600 [Gordonia lacunae]